MFKIFAFLGLLISITACRHSRHISHHTANNNIQTDSSTLALKNKNLSKGTTDSILFLFFKVENDSTQNKITIKLDEVKKVLGRTKHELSPPQGKQDENTLEVFFLDRNMNPVKRGSIEHPLRKRIEYIDEEGNYKWAIVAENEFFIQISYSPNYSFIRFKDGEQITDIKIFENY